MSAPTTVPTTTLRNVIEITTVRQPAVPWPARGAAGPSDGRLAARLSWRSPRVVRKTPPPAASLARHHRRQVWLVVDLS